jgi:pimeloyl-ACP methyl ester carboxylesterase
VVISRANAPSTGQLLRLADGRRLCFAEYGAPGGRPVMFFHGTPGTRLLARTAHETARKLNVRLIAPERPGFGHSDFQPGRRIAQWPDDVLAIADALGLARFAVVGVSGGGPYALACAWRRPDRVAGVGIVSGMVPLADPSDGGPLDGGHYLNLTLLRRAPWLLRGALALAAPAVRRWPGAALDLMAGRVPAVDRAILARPEVRAALVDDLREALRCGGRGTAQELALFGRPWGFRPADVQTPVELWHGEADRQVPVTLARRLARQIPHCQARFLPTAGHFWLLDHSAEVLATLCTG